jgi:endonuclease YncB( thermonuclease family)
MIRRPPLLILLTLSAAPMASTAPAAERIPGPVIARVLKVQDGDTFLAEAHVWPGHHVRVRIRIRGVDAPELKGACAAERAAAERARDALDRLIHGRPVEMRNIGGDKYFGRVLADVRTSDAGDLGAWLLDRDLARPYRGGRRAGWCR